MTPQKTTSDICEILRQYTEARIALGRTGASLNTNTILSLNEAHANARDSIYQAFEKNNIEVSLKKLNLQVVQLESKVNSKKEFLMRPDLGRQLHEESKALISAHHFGKAYDVCLNVSEGLSATAVNAHAIPLLNILVEKLEQANLSIAPVCLISNGRVAISDETGSLFNATISIMLIGERPGLSASDSMGAYITYHPQPGNTDEQRNCVSNIRVGGLNYEEAANEIFSIVELSIRLKMSGNLLKNSAIISR